MGNEQYEIKTIIVLPILRLRLCLVAHDVSQTFIIIFSSFRRLYNSKNEQTTKIDKSLRIKFQTF